MFRIKTNTDPCVFQTEFIEIQHKCLTRFSKNSLVENQLVYSQTKYFRFLREPGSWNNLLVQQQ